MAKSTAKTVSAYLKELPADRRAVISAVRDVILANLPDGYRETMNWGVICYEIPLERYARTYNDRPACYAALAAQKNYNAVYLMGIDGPKQKLLAEAFRKIGKKMDMGKSCLRFKKLEDIPLETVGKLIASVQPDAFIAWMEAAHRK